MIKACIFDLDGTLADTLASIAYFANNALKTYGLKEIETQRYRWLVGDGASELVRRMLVIAGDYEFKYFDKVSALYSQSYDENFLYLTTAYAGMPETIAALKAKGIKLAVLSNKPHATTCKIVESLYGSDVFDLCYGQRQGSPLKPDPTVLLEMIKELGVNPEECLYLGDTAVDMVTGHRAGVRTVGVLWGFRDRQDLEEHDADWIISKPEELLTLISKS